jgi:nucleoside-diphosphate-sugar epimerase
MRIFVAGASSAIGRQLVPLLVAAGHTVAGMTRHRGKTSMLRELGAEPVVCDVFDGRSLTNAVVGFRPDVVIHELTDLPDDPEQIPEKAPANNRIRREGTRNLLAAAEAAGAKRLLAQSVAFPLPGDGGRAVEEHEAAVLATGGTVLRYGRFYGPGTYHEYDRAPAPAVHVAEAARRTVDALDAPSGTLTIVDPEPL